MGSGRDAYPFQTPPGAGGFIGRAELCLCVCADQHRSVLSDDDRAFRLGRNLRLADIFGEERLSDAARRLPPARALHDGLFGQIRQRADAPLHILSWPVCHSRHDRRGQSWAAGVARVRPAFTRQRGDALCDGAATRRGNPHRRISVQRCRARRAALRIRARFRPNPPYADAQSMGARSAGALTGRARPSPSRINSASSGQEFARLGVAFSFCLGYQANLDRTGASRLRRPLVQRRQFIAGAAGLIAGSLAPRLALANVPTPFAFDMAPPVDNRDKFVAWGVAQRGEDPKFLGERFDRFGAMVRNEDLVNDRNKHAFLLTPREKFVLQQNLSRAYEHAFLDIGYGVTISGPHIVGRMTSNIDVKL